MDNDRINELIALKLGWKRAETVYFDGANYVNENNRHPDVSYVPVLHWLDPVTKRTGAVPDWAGDLNLAATLLGSNYELERVYIKNGAKNLFYVDGKGDAYTNDDPVLSRGICRAWLKSEGIDTPDEI